MYSIKSGTSTTVTPQLNPKLLEKKRTGNSSKPELKENIDLKTNNNNIEYKNGDTLKYINGGISGSNENIFSKSLLDPENCLYRLHDEDSDDEAQVNSDETVITSTVDTEKKESTKNWKAQVRDAFSSAAAKISDAFSGVFTSIRDGLRSALIGIKAKLGYHPAFHGHPNERALNHFINDRFSKKDDLRLMDYISGRIEGFEVTQEQFDVLRNSRAYRNIESTNRTMLGHHFLHLSGDEMAKSVNHIVQYTRPTTRELDDLASGAKWNREHTQKFNEIMHLLGPWKNIQPFHLAS